MKKIQEIKVHIFIFYTSYILILFATMFKQVKGLETITSIATQLGMGLLLFACIINLNQLTLKRALILIIVILIAGITKIITGTNTLLIMCLLIIAGKNIELEKVIKYDLKVKTIFLLIVSTLYFLGLTNVNIHYRNGVIRHSMGFSNPNTFSTFVMSITIEYLYLKRKKLNIRDLLVVVVSILIISYYADSRTQIICVLLLTLMLFINKYVRNIFFNNKLFDFLTTNSFIILTIISFVSIFFFNQGNGLLIKINENMSGRLNSISEILDEYDINLFGNKIKLVTSMESKLTGEEGVALDNTYIYALLSYGLVPFVILCIFVRKYMKVTIQEEKDTLRLIMIVFLIGGIMERFCMEIHFNIFWLYFSHILYEKEKISVKVDEKNILGEMK